MIYQIKGCLECKIETSSFQPLNFQNILDFSKEHNLQPMSFFEEDLPLSEGEFNFLLDEYDSLHSDSDDWRSKSHSHIELRWKNLECGHIFDTSYRNVLSSNIKNYCPTCVLSIDQQRTLEVAEELFVDNIIEYFRSNHQLYKFLPRRILMMDKYKAISDPRVHVDMYAVINVNGKEFKIAIEHQGAQHYSFNAFLDLVMGRDIREGIYITIDQYKQMYDDQLEKDAAKVELFEDLNKDGYYLIVVPHYIRFNQRRDFILQKFRDQTDVIPSQSRITDYL